MNNVMTIGGETEMPVVTVIVSDFILDPAYHAERSCAECCR